MRIAILSFALLLTLITPNTITNETKTNTDLQLDKVYIKQTNQFPDRKVEVQKAKEWDMYKAEVARIEAEKARLSALAAQSTPQAQNTPQASPALATAPSGGCDELSNRLIALGVASSDVQYAIFIASKESGCRSSAVNRSSGACGEFQSNPCGKWGTPGTDQYLLKAIAYANGRYHSWQNAYRFWNANHWW